jgi:hypothetical protein
MRWITWIPIAIGSCVLAGCAMTQTGEPIMSPEAIETIDAVASVAEPLGMSLAVLYPPAAVLGGVLAGVFGAWRRMKPKVIEAEDAADIAVAAGESTAFAIDEFKKAHPEEWGVLSDYLTDHHGPIAESFYRALRGLPPKD